MSRYVSWCTAITQPTAAKILSSIDTMMETIYKTNNHQLA
jgi:zona occludens toxin (predicted ATPase)